MAVRTLRRSPMFVTVTVLSLGLGIGAAIAAFSVVDAIRFRALPFPESDRLVTIGERSGTSPGSGAGMVSFNTWDTVLRTHRFRSLEGIGGFWGGGKLLVVGDDPVMITAGVLSPETFGLLRVAPILGRLYSAEEDRYGNHLVALMSHDAWTTWFGQDRGIIGQTVKLSENAYTILGVMPPGFDFESGSQFWIPVAAALDPRIRPTGNDLDVLGRLAPGATLAELEAELSSLTPAVATTPDPGPPNRLTATPLRHRYIAATRSHDLVFAAIVALVLLIALMNVANLILVRAVQARRDLAIRAALGAGAGRLARHLLAQNLILAMLGGLLGVLLANWTLDLLPGIAALRSLRLPAMEYRLDLHAVGFAMGLVVVLGLALSVAPAALLARTDPQEAMRAGALTATTSAAGHRLQHGFVIFQIACAVLLLTGTGLMARTMWRVHGVDLGYEPRGVVRVSPAYPHGAREKPVYLPLTREIGAALAQQPGVGAVAVSASVPLTAGTRNAPGPMRVGAAGDLPGGLRPRVAMAIGPDYFTVLGIPMLAGRPFSEADGEGAAPVAIVNAWAASHWWPGESAIGQTVTVDATAGVPVTLTVVGVVPDHLANRGMLASEGAPELYRPFLQAPTWTPSFLVRTTDTRAEALIGLRRVVQRLVPDRPNGVTLLQTSLDLQFDGVRGNALQVAGVAAVGLMLALVGLYGVLAAVVSQRTREIGIRLVLGATPGSVLGRELRRAAGLCAAGVGLGLALAALTLPLIRGMFYGTPPADPLVYLGVAVVLGLVGLAAGYVPARRAARVEPAATLRAL